MVKQLVTAYESKPLRKIHPQSIRRRGRLAAEVAADASLTDEADKLSVSPTNNLSVSSATKSVAASATKSVATSVAF